jgi:formylglycine-generating enzyme required for sulfatase activity
LTRHRNFRQLCTRFADSFLFHLPPARLHAMKKTTLRILALLLAILFSSASAALAQALQITTNATLEPILAGSPGSISFAATGGTAPYSWAHRSGNLPPGMSLDPTTGVLSGTPTSAGSFSFSIRVTDRSTPVLNRSKTFSLTVRPDAPTITRAALPSARAEVPYSHRFEATGGRPPYQWTTTSALPRGLSFDKETGILSGTPHIDAAPTTARDYTIAVTATGANGQFSRRSFRLTVQPTPPPTITSRNLEPGELGEEYFDQIEATGGKTPYTFASTSRMPNDLVVNPDGTVTGTPRVAGNLGFRVRVTGSDNKFSTAVLRVTVSDAPSPKITSASPLYGFVDSPFITTLEATGGKPPYRWTRLGTSADPLRNLPPGVTLAENGSFSGSPEAAGEYRVALRVTDDNGKGNTKTFTIFVSKGSLAIKTVELDPAFVGTPYRFQLEAEGGRPAYSWSLADRGTLPATISLSPSGLLSGTPAATGSFSFTVRLSDSTTPTAVTVEKTFTLTVAAYNLQITTASLPAAKQGTFYTTPIQATGGKTPYRWAPAAPLPAALAINSSTGVLSGNITAVPGTPTVSLRVTDANRRSFTRNLTLTIGEADPLVFEPLNLPDAAVATTYSATLAATGGVPPYRFTRPTTTILPGGLRHSGARLSGRPTVSGDFTLPFTVTDSSRPTARTTTADLTLRIASYGMEVTGPDTASGRQFEPLSPATFQVTGGRGAYKWSLGTSPRPPAAVRIHATTGVLSGNLTATPGNYPVTVIVTDANRQTASKLCTVTIQQPALLEWITDPTLPPGKVGVSYNATLEGRGGRPARTFALKTGSKLPLGLQLTAGRLTGTPRASGSFQFTLTLRDAAGTTRDREFTLVIDPADVLEITTTDPLPPAYLGEPYAPNPAVFQAAGGLPRYNWSRVGTWPAQFVLNRTGALSLARTANLTGDFTLGVRVADALGANATANFTITVLDSRPLEWVTPPSLPNGSVLAPYTGGNLSVQGGFAPYTFSRATGSSLPSPLTLTGNRITGTPATAGTSNFTLVVRDSKGVTASREFTLAIDPYDLAITEDSPSRIPGTVGQLLNPVPFNATGGREVYAWSLIGEKPAWLTMTAATGVLSGRPTAAGNFTVTVRVTDARRQFVEKTCILEITDGTPLEVEFFPIEEGAGPVVGQPFFHECFEVSGGTPPYRFAATGLPAGLTLTAAGALSGTPTVGGSFPVVVTITDARGLTHTQECPLVVTSDFAITEDSPSEITGTAHFPLVPALFDANGGTAPYLWTISPALPAPLALGRATGLVTGTPAAAITSTHTVTVTDANKQTATKSIVLRIAEPDPIAWDPAPQPDEGKVASPYDWTIPTPNGGVPGFTYTLKTGTTRPPGLAFSSAGRFSGNPSTAGTYSFVVIARDTKGNTAELPLTIVIAPYGMEITGPETLIGHRYTALPEALFEVTGGQAAYRWSTLPTLPASLTLKPITEGTSGNLTASITGNLNAAPGNYSVTLSVRDGKNQTANFTTRITILPPEPLEITTPADLGIVEINTPFETTLEAKGGRPGYRWAFASRGNLPANASLTTNGILTVNSTTALTANFTVRVTDANSANTTKDMTLRFVESNNVTDSDGDGVNDYRELYDGTDPLDPTSFNPLSIGLIVNYTFEEDFSDHSGYQNDLVNRSPGLQIIPDRFGNDFGAVNIPAIEDFGYSNNITGITGNQNHSITFWVYLEETPAWEGTKYSGSLVTIGSTNGEQIGKESRVIIDSSEDFRSRLYAHGGYSDLQFKDSRPAFEGQWRHVVFSYNGRLSTSSLYLDGKKLDAEVWGGLDNLRNMLDGLVYLGSTPTVYGNSSAAVSRLSDIRIYNRALTAAEVSQLYSEESGEPNMVLVQGGTLPEGSELAGQTVSAFHIARFETTWAEWKQVRAWAAANGYDIGDVGEGSADNHPVRAVNWYDAVKWCNAKSEMDGLVPVYTANGTVFRAGDFAFPERNPVANGYRLPTEAEWEWSARGGALSQGFIYSGSNDLEDVGWYFENSMNAIVDLGFGRGTWPVGAKLSNELDLYDMSGNVLEWCENLLLEVNESYHRSIRGGDWRSAASSSSVLHRGRLYPWLRYFAAQEGDQRNSGGSFGFRLARNAIGDMVTVQGGTLPESSELAGQTVQTFQIGRTEVTWDEWQTVRDWAVSNGYADLAGVGQGSAGNHPVRNVSWYDVVKWTNAKSQLEGLSPVYMVNGIIFKTGQSAPTFDPTANGYRLPREAEWEWAARGGVNSLGYTYSGSNDFGAVGWNYENSIGAIGNEGSIAWGSQGQGRGTWPVGQKSGNELGIFDLSGNVAEFCWDEYNGFRHLRGGSFMDTGEGATVFFRTHFASPSQVEYHLGFRLARNIGPKISIIGELPEAVLNQPYAGFTFGVSGTNAPVAWSIPEGTLPPGMSFSTTGTLSGTPSQAGLYTFVLRVESGGYWDEVEVELEVVVGGVVDSDGDGVNDYRELYDGTDPMDPTSFNPLSIGLIAHYPFDGNPKDESGYGKNGKIVGTVLPSPDRFGDANKSYLFDGSTGLISAEDPDLIKAEDNLTLVAWIKATEEEFLGVERTSGTSYAHKYVVGGGGNHGGILLAAGTNGISVLEHGFQFLPVVLSYPTNLNSDWVQVVITCTNNGPPVLYLNGKYVRTGLNSGRKKILSAFSPEEVAGIGGGGYGKFKGNIDEVRIYSRALSAAEVSQLYAEESGQPNMVLVQGGTLPVGSELAGQTVSAFHIARFETTWAEWKQVRTWAAANGYDIGNAGQGSADNHPVRNVIWYDVVKWCNAKSEMEGFMPVYLHNGSTFKQGSFGASGSDVIVKNHLANGFRLPIEAEWEWAAFGGVSSQGYLYSGSNTLDEVGWHFLNSNGALVDQKDGRGTWAVGLKSPNELGIYDMSGNALEFCWDEVQLPTGLDRRLRERYNSEIYDVSGYMETLFRWDPGTQMPPAKISASATPATPSATWSLSKAAHCRKVPNSPGRKSKPSKSAARKSLGTNGKPCATGPSPMATHDLGEVGIVFPFWIRTGEREVGNYPVRDVSLNDAVKWCNAKSEKEGLTPVYSINGTIYRIGKYGWWEDIVIHIDKIADGYRLPSEVEWEWASRGGADSQGYIYSGSNDVNAVAWHWDNSGGSGVDVLDGRSPWPVGCKAPNELGIYDMGGNVWEWCGDINNRFKSRLRGGSWLVGFEACDHSNRGRVSDVNYRGSNESSFGFRLARNVQEPSFSLTGTFQAISTDGMSIRLFGRGFQNIKSIELLHSFRFYEIVPAAIHPDYLDFAVPPDSAAAFLGYSTLILEGNRGDLAVAYPVFDYTAPQRISSTVDWSLGGSTLIIEEGGDVRIDGSGSGTFFVMSGGKLSGFGGGGSNQVWMEKGGVFQSVGEGGGGNEVAVVESISFTLLEQIP